MNLGTFLQIIIALIFIYLLSSLIISELQEQCAALLEFRARNLKQALEIFLGKKTTESLYESSFFSSFNQYTNRRLNFKIPIIGQSVGPSYIEPKIVAEALIMLINDELDENKKLLKSDLVGEFRQDPNDSTGILKKIQSIKSLQKVDPTTIDKLKEIAFTAKLKHDNPKLEEFVDEIAITFTQIMDRTSGVYKRNAKGVSLLFGFLAAFFLNIDSFYVINQLYKNPVLTQEINKIATTAVEKHDACRKGAKDDQQAIKKCDDDAMNESKKLEGLTQPLPIGWNNQGWFNPEQIKAQNGWLQAILGWFMTGVAVAMGAPFWFDLLGKVINVRNTGNPISSKKNPN